MPSENDITIEMAAPYSPIIGMKHMLRTTLAIAINTFPILTNFIPYMPWESNVQSNNP